MASQTYTCDVIVLKKTKLGEADLILTCLASDGQQVRFKAKGARKPQGSFAARLELFSCVHVLLAKGRGNLDLVTDARLIDGHPKLRRSVEKSTAAATVAEFLARTTQDGLDAPRLYDMTNVALHAIEHSPEGHEAAAVATFLVKAFAFCGFAPSLDSCASCGTGVNLDVASVRLSYDEGGVICDACRPHVPTIEVPSGLVRWIGALLRIRFDQLGQLDVSQDVAYDVLRFCQSWSCTHVGHSIKSLDFMITMALPPA